MNDDINAKIDAVFSKYPKRTYPKGQILVFADESPEFVFYLVKGKVRKYDVSYRGEEVIVNIFQPPAFFPMSWAIDNIPNRFFYKTEAETELHIVPGPDAVKILQDNPDIMFDLLRRLYSGIEGLLGRVVHLMSGTAKSRLMYELIIECHRFGNKDEADVYRLQTSESDLAARTGLTRETVSREMKKLKDNKWVSVETKEVVVRNLPAIEAELGVGL